MMGAAARQSPFVDVVTQPTDNVSAVRWSANRSDPYLCSASCWDGRLMVYRVDPNSLSSQLLVHFATQPSPSAPQLGPQPLLSHAWHAQQMGIFTGGADNTVKYVDLATQQETLVGTHADAVRHVYYIPDLNVVASGSWDRTVRYWDMRQPGNAAASIQLSERVYAMDTKSPMLAVGLADKSVHIVDLRNPGQTYMRVEHQLKYQIRCIACFAPPLTGVVIGSIEGRCSVNHLTPQSGKSFPFKCHRNPDNPDRSRSSEPVDVYPVNEIAVHPQRQTIATVGGDGYVNFWDTGAQLRLSHVQPRTRPTFLTSCSFSVDGAVLAVADSYDWSHGHDATLVNRPSKVLLYKVQSRDIHKT